VRVCLAQINPAAGDIELNVSTHVKWVGLAFKAKAELIAFPELSLTGYEPELAESLATSPDDYRLHVLQKLSNKLNIGIAAGLPVRTGEGICISLLIYQPGLPVLVYSKQMLHSDELPYFIPGQGQIIFSVKGNKIAPAICYESLQPEHAREAHRLGAGFYLASVAKSKQGIKKARLHYPDIARRYSMAVMMVNSIGYCDNFFSTGMSAIWDKYGVLSGQLDDIREGMIIYDTSTGEVETIPIG